jgi:hypothetical protein
MTMTPKQRIQAVLRGELPDRVPLTVYRHHIPTGEDERRLRERGLAFHHRVAGFKTTTPNCTSERYRYEEGGNSFEREVLRTPVGEVTALQRLGTAYGSNWTVEHFIKRPEDYRVIQFVTDDTVFEPNVDAIRQAQADLGEDGWVSANTRYSAMHRLMQVYTGVEQFCYDWADHPEEVMSLYEAMVAAERRFFPLFKELPTEVVYYCGNVSGEVVGGERFEKYYLPRYNECGEYLHEAGKLMASHQDAILRPFIHHLAGSRLDIIEAFTPEPDTDISVREAREIFGDKILWMNFPSSVHLADREGVRRATEHILDQIGDGDRFILGNTEAIPDFAWRTSLSGILDVLEARGAAGPPPAAGPLPAF